MRGFVLAAGFGKRLLPLTESVPKPLLPVGNVPLIGYALKLLAHHGITEVAVNVHHLGRQIMDVLGDGSNYGVSIYYSEEEEILGTGGGIKEVESFLGNDTFVVVNSDTVMDVDLKAAIEQHKHRQALATMILREDPRKGEFGQIEINSNGRICKILGQGAQTSDALRSLMFTGVHIMEPRMLEYIPPNVETGINRYAYTKALRNDESLYGCVADRYWSDFGTPKRYLDGNIDALEQSMALPYLDPLAGFAMEPKKDVAEVVRMGKDVQLGANTLLIPPVILGDGAKIQDGATVGPHCVIGARCVIGKQTQISRAVVLEGAKVEAGATIKNIIVGKKASLPIDDTHAASLTEEPPRHLGPTPKL